MQKRIHGPQPPADDPRRHERGCMSDFPIRSRKGEPIPTSDDAHMPETKPPREPGGPRLRAAFAACALLLLCVGVGVVTGVSTDYGVVSTRVLRECLKVATWNIAAINNNPFEYWITRRQGL